MPFRVLTSEVTSKHEVEDEKAVLVVLEGIAQVDDERVIDLNDSTKRKRILGTGPHMVKY